MKIEGFNHIGINIKDIGRSLAFYCDILRANVQFSAKMDDCTITYLQLESGSRIELFDYYGNNRVSPPEESQVGYRHIAIQVDDTDAWELWLKKNNVPIVLASTDIPALHVRVLLFKDPDGTVLEFCKAI